MNVRELLHEFQQTAAILGQAELDDESWVALRRLVIDLIERGSALAPSSGFAAIHWDETDCPVLLARAFGTVHTRLVAAGEQPAAARRAACRFAAEGWTWGSLTG